MVWNKENGIHYIVVDDEKSNDILSKFTNGEKVGSFNAIRIMASFLRGKRRFDVDWIRLRKYYPYIYY